MKQRKKPIFDYYTVYARVFPALLSSLPLFVLWYFVSDLGELSGLMSYVLSLKLLGSLTFSVVFIYYYAQLVRTVSKLFEKKYFMDGRAFPTTYLMLYGDDTLSREYKDAYRKKANSRFEVKMPTEEDEHSDLPESKKRITEVTKLIILLVGEGQLVFKHNVWYGFFRNLVGGAIFGVVFAIFNVVIGITVLKNTTLWMASVVLIICFGFLVLWRKSILTQHAEAHAKQLIAEFMALGESGSSSESTDDAGNYS